MPLSTGDRLGRYEITTLLGKGGMGEVYRARDPQLKRDVAIKVSTAQFTDRFRREAEAVAALNHPNICTLHDVGADHLVMELVEGPTLAERMAAGAIPLDEAFALARQIADALEHAHARGVIHRDLKPVNVKVRPDGTLKVLDFGLAKVVPAATGSGADTGTTTMADVTHAGVILGTAAYMSPEQAAGQEVDRRTDIWAFGVVLYEMLTGRPLFRGETPLDTLALVRMKEPDWEKTPARARVLLKWCLQRNPAKRLRDIGDARLFLDEGSEAFVPTEPHPTKYRHLGWFAAAAVALLAAAAWLSFDAPTNDRPLRVSSLLAPEGSEYNFVSAGSFVAIPALSPDGTRLVFGARSPDGKATQLWVRSLDSQTAQPLPGTEGASRPFWSPDSRYVAFGSAADRALKKIDVLGGPPVTITPLAEEFQGGSWNAEGVIIFADNSRQSPIMKVSNGGGTPVPASSVEKDKDIIGHRSPWFLPNGRHFVYLAPHTSGPNALRIGSLDDASTPGKEVAEADSNGQFSQGHLLYLRSGTLMAQPLDVDRLETTGDARAIAEGIPTSLQPGRVAHFTVSASGLLVYPGRAPESSNSRLVWKDRSGTQVSTLEEVQGRIVEIQLSPDRKRLLASLTERTNNDLWIYDIASSRRTRFTFDPGAEPYAVWTPDGNTIIWRNGRGDLYRKDSSAVGADEVLLSGPGLSPRSVSPDGKTLLHVKGGIDVWALSLMNPPGDPFTPRAILNTSSGEDHPQFSPDGKWMAYTSSESGTREAYVIDYSTSSGRRQVSSGGASHVRWRSDGRELFYVTREGILMAAEIAARGQTLEVGRIQKLFGSVITTVGYLYDASADGSRFIVAQEGAETVGAARPPLTLVENWTALLTRR
jgi:eukaryotic-like serine/threonine-protein kinase